MVTEIERLKESFVENYNFWRDKIDKINKDMVSNSVTCGIKEDDVRTFSYNDFCKEYLEGAVKYEKKFGMISKDNIGVIVVSMIAKRLKVTFRDYQYTNTIDEIKSLETE